VARIVPGSAILAPRDGRLDPPALRPDRRLEPHFEQKHHHADPGEKVDAGIGLKQARKVECENAMPEMAGGGSGIATKP